MATHKVVWFVWGFLTRICKSSTCYISVGSVCIWCFVNMLAKKCLLLGSDFLHCFWHLGLILFETNGIFLREFRAGKKPSYTSADHLYFLSCLQKLTGVICPYPQNDPGWEQMLSAGHVGEGAAVPECLITGACGGSSSLYCAQQSPSGRWQTQKSPLFH